MDELLAKKLIFLADKYENSSFCKEDPSQFLRWYNEDSQKSDVEVSSFLAAMLAFGNRKQFIPKIKELLTLADKFGGLSLWIKKGSPDFPRGSKKFYRFYSYDDMHIFFNEISAILSRADSLGEYFKSIYFSQESGKNVFLCDIISMSFPKSKLVSKGKNSANKRINMFLRWMVRQKSAVDLGLWTWYSPKDLIIPLDVHVLQEASALGLLPQKAMASRKNALLLTNLMSQVFIEDPCRADFALFGLGVDKDK